MGNIVQIACKTIGTTEETLYNSATGVIIKSILIYNTTGNETNVTITLDAIPFIFTIPANDNKVINLSIVTNEIKVISDKDISLNMSGIELN